MAAFDPAEATAGDRGGLGLVPHAADAAEDWLQVLPHLDPVYGGLTAVVPRLACEIRTQEHLQVRVAAFCVPGEERFADSTQPMSVWPLARSAWASQRKLKKDFQAEVTASSGVHIHGLWESSTMVAVTAARQAGVPYMLSAHGMLDPWALANKRWKKLAYAALFERSNVCGAACLHALTGAEADDYRRFGYKGPIAVIPNGVEATTEANPELFLGNFPSARGMDVVLFLGRIHYKKGVDLLVRAWAQIASNFPRVLLVLAGPDSEGTLLKVKQSVAEAHLQDRVLFTGMLDAALKWSALAAAKCFVLPSYSEGLSVAVLEALAMGVPVILSGECHLPQVAEHRAGWLVETNTASLAQALEKALDSSREQREKRGHRARNLAASEFSWSSVAGRMAEVYRWVGGGAFPEHVEMLRVGS